MKEKKKKPTIKCKNKAVKVKIVQPLPFYSPQGNGFDVSFDPDVLIKIQELLKLDIKRTREENDEEFNEYLKDCLIELLSGDDSCLRLVGNMLEWTLADDSYLNYIELNLETAIESTIELANVTGGDEEYFIKDFTKTVEFLRSATARFEFEIDKMKKSLTEQ